MLIENTRGSYSFLKGISPYSAGVVAFPGFEIEHARFRTALPLHAGFAAIEAHLTKQRRPRQALCGVELRSPRAFSFTGFSEFNGTYVAVLKSWQILQDGLNPVARTNVAPEVDPPSEVVVYGFSYTIPASDASRTFVVAGAGELPEGTLDPHQIVRRGETGPEALAEKSGFVLGLMEARLRALGASWSEVTTTSVYTVHNIGALLAPRILPAMGKARWHGVLWYYARPPIEGIEYEMDLRGCRRESIIPA